MIKWGRRKKQQSPSSPRPPSLLSSWLLRLKKMGGNDGGDKDIVKDKPVKAIAPPPCRRNQNSPSTQVECYGGDDAFWRLSFRKGKEDDDDGGETEEEEEEEDDNREVKNFSEMVSGIRRMKLMQRSAESLPELKLRRRSVKDRELKKTPCTRRKLNALRFEDSSTGEFSPEMERKSVYRGSPKRRTKQPSCRVRVKSPRAAAASRGAAKKAAAAKEEERNRRGLERFAVVKCSMDPQRDFRESMVEMILERRICRPQELEELLACYLALNSDEYHHLIIKVFRQIWFELNQPHYGD